MVCVMSIGLVTVAGVFFGLLLRNQTKTIEDLKRAREELQLEESRVFDFLHGLGETFTRDVRVADLHRLMVEGALRIFEAHGGAHCGAGRPGKMLLPLLFYTAWPPPAQFPPEILSHKST